MFADTPHLFSFDWQAKCGHLQALGFPLNLDGFILACVDIQRALRDGFQYAGDDLDVLVIEYAQSRLTKMTDKAFFEQFAYSSSKRVQDPQLTFRWITDAIACSRNELAMYWANLWDMERHFRHQSLEAYRPRLMEIHAELNVDWKALVEERDGGSAQPMNDNAQDVSTAQQASAQDIPEANEVSSMHTNIRVFADFDEALRRDPSWRLSATIGGCIHGCHQHSPCINHHQ